AYRWSARDGESYDPYVDAATALMRSRLVGFKVVGTDSTSKSFRFGDINFLRQLFIVDVYAQVPPINPEQDAIVAPPFSALPWHVIVLLEEAVTRGWAAFSSEEAKRLGVPWLDLARSAAMNERLAALGAAFAPSGYRPAPLQSLVSVEDARKRWAALAAFYKERGHFLVTNGPYKLKAWSADGVSLEAFRDLSYPLGVGSYDNYAVPRRGYVTAVTQADGQVTLSGDIEVLQKHSRSYDIVRTPLPSVRNDELARSAPECRYMVTDETGRVVLAGQIPVADDAKFHIDLRDRLPPGRFTLHAQIMVNGNAMAAEIKRIPVAMSSARGPPQAKVRRAATVWPGRIPGLLCRLEVRPRVCHAHHAVAGDDGGELVFAPVLCPGRTTRNDEIAQIGQAVVNAHDHVAGKLGAEFAQHLARLLHDASPVVLAAVPVRRQAKHGARIAGTQRTDHDVLHRGSVLEHRQLCAAHVDAEIRHRLVAVSEQTLLE